MSDTIQLPIVGTFTGLTEQGYLNAALLALGTWYYGVSAPATTHPKLVWADSTTGLIKQRDAADANWVIIGTMDDVFHGHSRGQAALTAYLLPSLYDGWRGIYRAGFDWWSRNQQWGGPWGGELLDSGADTLIRTEFATGYIDDDGVNSLAVGDASARTYVFQSFIVPETQTLAGIWIKLLKVGNPTNNLGLTIISDSAGVPSGTTPITNGTATALSGKLFQSGDATGQWIRFNFATPPTLTGGTKYHILLKSSGAVDASNYWKVKLNAAKKYPFGNRGVGDNTPTYTGTSASALMFLVELSAGAQILQSGGVFDGVLQFGGAGASGTLSQSRGLANLVPLRELIPDPSEFTLWIVGTAFNKDVTILDIGWGEDHDRVVLRANASTLR